MGKLKVLIIDDDKSFNDLVTPILQEAGLNVTITSSAKEVLAWSASESFHLILYSNNLTEMPASDFCGQLRAIEAYDFVPILVMTEQNTANELKKALLSGATDTFSKHDFGALRSYIERLVQRESFELSGRVLLIEDSRVLQAILFDLLTELGLDVDAYTHAEDAWSVYPEGDYDLVLTDILLGGTMSGLTLVRNIRRMQGQQSNVPIIASSGFDNKARKVELFHHGVNDFISKPVVREELRQRVINHITTYQSIRELRTQERSLYSLSMLDDLTHLFNRHALREFSGKFFADAYGLGQPLSMAVLDIDYFQKINKENGHIVGDQVLSELGKWLKRFARDVDLVARWAGDEFIFLLANCSQKEASQLIERLQSRLKNFNPAGIEVSLSIGIASTSEQDKERVTLNGLFELADSAMYQAKIGGRNRIELSNGTIGITTDAAS